MFYGSRHNISETLLMLALNTNQSISQYFNLSINILWSYGCIKPLSTILFILFRWNLNATELKSPTNFVSSSPLHVTDFYVDIKSTTVCSRLDGPLHVFSVITFQNDTCILRSSRRLHSYNVVFNDYLVRATVATPSISRPNIIVVSGGTDISRNHTKSDSSGLLNITGHQFIIIGMYTTTLEIQDLEYHGKNWHQHCQLMTA
jgi:hypothetical protein